MKKIIIAILLTAFVSSLAYAQVASAPGSQPPVAAQKRPVVPAEKSLVGKIAAITMADPMKGIPVNSVSIVNDAGKVSTFVIEPSTKLLDEALNAIPISQLKAGDKVKIAYTVTAEGKHEAASISITK